MTSPVIGRYMHKVGKANALIIGIFLIIAGILALGAVDYVDDKTWFVVVSFIAKAVLGIGSGMNSTAIISIIASIYKHDREQYLGMVESSSGIGLLLGPIAGSLLYLAGGYVLPFAVLGGTYFLIWPFIAGILRSLREQEQEAPERKVTEKKVS